MENKTNTRADKVEILFATHPKADVIYMTSNDKAFFDEQAADSVAQTLSDKAVEAFKRDDSTAIDQLEKDAMAKAAEEAKKLEEAKAEEEARKLQAFNEEQKLKDAEADQRLKDALANQKKIDAEAAQKAFEKEVANLPEGTPTKEGWTIPQIQTWLTSKGVNFSARAKEDNLLGKVEEFLNAQNKNHDE